METTAIPKTVAFARVGFAAMALLAPRLATQLIGAKIGEETPAAAGWAGLFASREAALGVLTLASEHSDTGSRRKVLLLNVAVETVDVLTVLTFVRRHRSIRPLFTLVPGGVVSALSHYNEAMKLRNSARGCGPRGK